MSPREGHTPNQPFIISKSEFTSQFKVLSATEGIKLREAEKPKSQESRKEKFLSLEEAETIIGQENFFGPGAVKKAFDVDFESKNIPDIPFSKEDLDRATKLGQFLVLRVDHAKDGHPLTPEKMLTAWNARPPTENNGSLLNNPSGWYKDEEFFTNDTPVFQAGDSPAQDVHARWALVSQEPVPDTTGKNYLQQTILLAGYVRQVFAGQTMPSDCETALLEFDQYNSREFTGKAPEEIQALLGGDATWKQYAAELSELKINQLTRHNFAEALYDMQIRFFNSDPRNQTRLLEKMYTWTKRLSSDGELVNVGGFGADGAGVSSSRPAYAFDGLGVSFSRSH
jgi:hypothetical protein